MKTFNYIVTDEEGLHARPAGLLAKTAKGLNDVTVTIEKNGKKAVATKLIALMGLGVKQNDTITVTIEGGDEEAAAKAIEELLTANL